MKKYGDVNLYRSTMLKESMQTKMIENQQRGLVMALAVDDE